MRGHQRWAGCTPATRNPTGANSTGRASPCIHTRALTRCAHGANPQLAGSPSLPGNGAPSMLQTPRSIASPFESSVKWIYRDARGVR
jgi:hypothetical protein